MTDELIRIENFLLKLCGILISNLNKDAECEEYDGYNFRLENKNVKYRKAKITPKKIGQFVTLWKRNAKGQTKPFQVEDYFDFYLIAMEKDERFGFFVFPKRVLSERQILSNDQKEGKRGFRVYAEWDKPESKQAEKTKGWQSKYFMELTRDEKANREKFNLLFKSDL